MKKSIIITIVFTTLSISNAQKLPPLEITEMGSFHIGGRKVEVTGKPVKDVIFTPGGTPAKIDPNGEYMVEQMYVNYITPKGLKTKYPVLMWHGGGLTGVSYETTPDGREGWQTYFARKGFKVYVSDAVERGRSGFASSEIWKSEPLFLTVGNPYERFRIGAGAGSWNISPADRKLLTGNQFPVDDYINFTKQIVPRWTTTDNATITAYTELVDRVCPCIVIAHSQAGQFGQKVAQARPELIKALVLIEPAGLGDISKVSALKMPILTLYGDFIEQDSRWPLIKKNQLDFNNKVNQAGGRVDLIDLPKVGVKGSSHMLMMDKNNLKSADVIIDWLHKMRMAK